MSDLQLHGVKRRATYGFAATILADRDPVIASLVESAGLPRLGRPFKTHFGALVRSIIHQQLAGSAASAIHNRLIEALDDDVDPARILALSPEALRSAGLSSNKASSLCDLAEKVLDGSVDLAPRRLSRASDDEIVARLTTVRGVGRWTAEMFLLFQLRRIDVWPTGDFGVRRGYSLAWGIPAPTPRDLEALGEPFRPYRSVAAWYCWRACDLYAKKAESPMAK
jgi:DNA-3-methyladenine glycosylase II